MLRLLMSHRNSVASVITAALVATTATVVVTTPTYEEQKTLALNIAVPFIIRWEGLENRPYRDIVGVWTVCSGETNVPMREYTDAECDAITRASVSRYMDRVLACSPDLIDYPSTLAAITSLSYNIGSNAYCRSTAARRINSGNMSGGCTALTWWTRAGTRVVQGLVNRRRAEYTLCMTYS